MRRLFHARSKVWILSAAFVLLHCSLCGMESFAADTNALYLEVLPAKYESLEKLFISFQDAGVTTFIAKMTFTEGGSPDFTALGNIIYLAHRAGMKLYIVMPTRSMPAAVTDEHPEWEDLEYIPSNGAIRQSGKLDLFNVDVVNYIVALASEAASYSADGILLDGDFSYSSFEGMSRVALKEAELKLGQSIRPGKLYERITVRPEGPIVELPGEAFESWTEMKSKRLVEVFDLLQKAVNAAQKNAVMGIAVPIVYPVANKTELMTRFAFDINVLKKLRINHFWTIIRQNEERALQTDSRRHRMEVISRETKSVLSSVRDQERTLLLLSVKAQDGRVLPLSEIEEMTALMRKAGGTSIGYVLTPETTLPSIFMQKIFRMPSTKTIDGEQYMR